MNKPKDVTIYDLARALKMSPSTVSRGLKDHPEINKNTKKKILQMARQMEYRSNTFASNLRRQSTHTIGVILHELHSYFIISVLAGIEKAASKAGYNLIIGHSSETAKLEAANADNLFNKRVDGLIASLAYDTENLSHFEQYKKKQIPVVFFDRVMEDQEGVKVIIDNYKNGYDATKHLIEQGCKNIAHITGSLKRNVYAERLRGYKEALENAGLKYRESYVLENDLTEEASVQAAHQVLKMKPLPDGIFITKDLCAAIVMHTLKDLGKRVPEDIAIVGFNNDEISRIVEPQLTTVNYPGITMGEIACIHLINHLGGISDINLTQTIIIKSELIIRGSSLKKTDALGKAL
ncbi:MAG TPA: LacI family DNA-binding transcriptional regulator [Parafilimonas sp.]|nr:LacI family DNA-binding transcriptional regulator [Parafilimonas sp.]